MRKKLVSGLILFIVLPLMLNPISATMEEVLLKNEITNKGNPDGIWTLMLYFCADTRDSEVIGSDNAGNTIHYELISVKSHIINEISPTVGSDINVIVLYDHPYTATDPNGHAVIYELTYGASTQVADWGITNMGSATTLSNFIAYCKTNYPADYYGLFLSDHGRGYAGICYDYHAPHPYFPYALGDCLELDEIELALSSGNEVDVLFLNCCQGSSFELAWQLGDVVDYLVGSESPGSPLITHHPRDVIYTLSRDISMTPREVALLGYDKAINPIHVPTGFDHWGSAVVVDVDLMSEPGSTALGFKEVFDLFTDMLVSEFSYNYTQFRKTFLDIRNSCITWGLDSSRSMMVDVLDFVEQVIAYNASLYNPDTLIYANLVHDWLTPGSNNIVMGEWYWWPDFTHLHGLNFCFPDTADMYQGFLWPNMYETLKISQETSWWTIIDGVYPTYDMPEFRIPDLYHIFIHPRDPVSQIHIYFDNDLLADPLHVGLNKDFDYNLEFGMGVELGIEGAEFHTDLQFGNTMIYIPAQSVQVGLSAQDAGVESLKVLIKTGATTDAMRTVNLTVKRIIDNEVIWEDNQIKEVEPGTVVSCELNNDSASDIIIEETPTILFGPIDTKDKISTSIIFPTMVILVIIGKRRKKQK